MSRAIYDRRIARAEVDGDSVTLYNPEGKKLGVRHVGNLLRIAEGGTMDDMDVEVIS